MKIIQMYTTDDGKRGFHWVAQVSCQDDSSGNQKWFLAISRVSGFGVQALEFAGRYTSHSEALDALEKWDPKLIWKRLKR